MSKLRITFLIYASAIFCAQTFATEPVNVAVDDPNLEIISDPGSLHEIDPRVPTRTVTSHFDVLVGEDGRAIRGVIVVSSGREWIDRKALESIDTRIYPVRMQNDEPTQYWLRNESYDFVIRAMNNRVDQLPKLLKEFKATKPESGEL